MIRDSKKIAIFSRTFDVDTDFVTDWLRYFNHTVYRFNGKDILNKDINIIISNTVQKSEIDLTNMTEFNAVWFRKGESIKINTSELEIDNYKTLNEVSQFLFFEGKSLKEAIYKSCSNLQTININSLFGFNKISNLKHAADSGLNIPSTMITSSKAEILKFKKKHENIITKPIFENTFFRYEDNSYGFYTKEVSEKIIAKKNNSFFPTLIQKKIPKLYEFRVFYLNNEIYCMAVFSGNLDYRLCRLPLFSDHSKMEFINLCNY